MAERKQHGHIYVILFSNGVIKVGQTHNSVVRLQTHESSARAFGLTIDDTWVSATHLGYQKNEQKLIQAVRDLGGSPNSTEFFTGVDFSDVVERAAALIPSPGRRLPGPKFATMTRSDWDAEVERARSEAAKASEFAAAIQCAHDQVVPYLAANDALTTADVAHLIRPEDPEPPPFSPAPAAAMTTADVWPRQQAEGLFAIGGES